MSHFDRLRDVARACRESPNPILFNMALVIHPCGAPACALGHYVARRDLSPRFGWSPRNRRLRDRRSHRLLSIDDARVLNWFGITHKEWDELFGLNGCRGARTNTAAADYIEQWCVEHERVEASRGARARRLLRRWLAR